MMDRNVDIGNPVSYSEGDDSGKDTRMQIHGGPITRRARIATLLMLRYKQDLFCLLQLMLKGFASPSGSRAEAAWPVVFPNDNAELRTMGSRYACGQAPS